MQPILNAAYDPDKFRKAGRELVDLLADYLVKARAGKLDSTIYWETPNQVAQFWEAYLDGRIEADPIALFREITKQSVKVHNPKFMGHQISPTVPVAALAGLLNDFLNNGMGVYEMGVASSAIERVVIKRVARKMGFDEEADGMLTSGGTLGNLTALLAARSVKAREKVWTEGSNGQLALMVSEEAHYCVDRAARIMGWGEAGIIKIPTNDRYEMRTELLESYLQEAQRREIEVIAVVGSACTTSTGSFDDLEAIASFCAQYDLWFHVDGAHGAAAALSSMHQGLVRGLERADSVVMDFHKTLTIPALSTALFFKNGRLSFRTFSQRAEYLWKSAEEEWYNLAKRTFECTKFMMSIKIYSVLHTYGFDYFAAYVDTVFHLGKRFARLIEARREFELAMQPACNIVCFRKTVPGKSDVEVNAVNAEIRQDLLEDGEYYIVSTQLRGKFWLRTTLTNPFTNDEQLIALLDRINSLTTTSEKSLA